MRKTIICGQECPNGNLYPAILDEKNLTTDWIQELYFINLNVAEYKNKMLGFANFCGNTFPLLAEWSPRHNFVVYSFPALSYLTEIEAKALCEMARDYFTPLADNLVIKFECGQNEDPEREDYFAPEFILEFFQRA